MVKHINPQTRLILYVGRFRTQQAAANALGVDKGFLSRMVRGKEPVSQNVMTKLGLRWIAVEVKSHAA